MREARMDIERGEDVYPGAVSPHEMNRVQLHEITGVFGWWPRHRYMTPFPGTASLQQIFPVKRSLHRRDGYSDTLLTERYMYDFR
jgi:hypothetical protein